MVMVALLLGATSASAQSLNHFQCYEVSNTTFALRPGVALVDRLGPLTVGVYGPHTLCAPSDKNGEDPTAPLDPDHLLAYRLRRTERFEKVFAQRVTNQFGTLSVDLVKPARLMVPTATSLTGPAIPIAPAIDHFTCYKVRKTAGTSRFARVSNVTIETSLETLTFDVRKPRRLCLPTDKNGETPGAENHPEHLMCYRIRVSKPVTRIRGTQVIVNNQFGQESYRLSGSRREFCVPSLIVP